MQNELVFLWDGIVRVYGLFSHNAPILKLGNICSFRAHIQMTLESETRPKQTQYAATASAAAYSLASHSNSRRRAVSKE